MSSTLRIALAALALPVVAMSQPRAVAPDPEIGVRVGWMRLSIDDGSGGTETVNLIAVPMASFLSSSGVHFTFFVNTRFAFEPQLGYTRTASSNGANSLFFLAMQPTYFLKEGGQRSPYLFAHAGVVRDQDTFGASSSSETHNVVGGGVGYRRVVRRSLALRYELRVRRIGPADPATEPITEFGLLLGLGAVIGGRSP